MLDCSFLSYIFFLRRVLLFLLLSMTFFTMFRAVVVATGFARLLLIAGTRP